MIIEIASYIGTAIASVGVYAGVKKLLNRNPKLTTPIGTEIDPSLPKLGFTTTDYNITDETEEQYMQRLKTLHSGAWKTYSSNYKKENILHESDRHVNMLILKFKNDEIKAESCGTTMDFEDGTEIWIGNKYYSYGYIWRNKRGLPNGESAGILSPYTFMSLVDLDMELNSFSKWKGLHDSYERDIHKRRSV